MWEGRCGVHGEKVGFVPTGSCGVICGQPWGGEFGRKVPVLHAVLLAAGEANRTAAQAVSALSREVSRSCVPSLGPTCPPLSEKRSWCFSEPAKGWEQKVWSVRGGKNGCKKRNKVLESAMSPQWVESGGECFLWEIRACVCPAAPAPPCRR